MIRINLLPQGHTPQPRPHLGVSGLLWASAVITALVGVGAYYGWQYSRLQNLQGELTTERSRLAGVEAELQRATRIASGEKTVAEQEERLRRLKGRTWSPLLLELRELTPRGITWLRMGLNQEEITISGRAEALSDLAHFLASLGSSPNVRQVDLRSARDEFIGGKESLREMSFELVIHLAPLQGGNGSGA